MKTFSVIALGATTTAAQFHYTPGAGTGAGPATCDPTFWSAGHDFKNMQYSHGPATSPGDCCAKCATYTDATIGQCKFWTFDGVDTCWFKSNNKGYRAGGKAITCGSVANVPMPTPAPTPPPTPAPPTPAPLPPVPQPTPTWDGKPVQVYIMMGQSNMLGEGHKLISSGPNSLEAAVRNEGKYQYWWDAAAKTWAVKPNMRNVFIMASGNSTFNHSVLQHNEWMTPGAKDLGNHNTIGPEYGIANGVTDEDNVLLLKSCIGNRALGWDLLPPGTLQHDFTDSKNVTSTYAGYGECPEKWPKGTQPAGTGKNCGWYAGMQWDGDIGNAQHVLANIGDFYPGADKYEVAGFFWWQGDKDSRDGGLSARYEFNLVNLIKVLRTTFKAPNAPFVTASLGQTATGATDGGGLILDAMMNVANATLYPDFKGNVAAVYTHPLEHTPGSSGAHYGRDGETYMNVGEAMGAAMAKLKAGKVVVQPTVAMSVAAATHYGDPLAGACMSDEQNITITGVAGSVCSPAATGVLKQKCPTDTPAGCTITPAAILQDQSGDKYCALECSPSLPIKDQKLADSICGVDNMSCKPISGVGICTYDA